MQPWMCTSIAIPHLIHGHCEIIASHDVMLNLWSRARLGILAVEGLWESQLRALFHARKNRVRVPLTDRVALDGFQSVFYCHEAAKGDSLNDLSEVERDRFENREIRVISGIKQVDRVEPRSNPSHYA